MADGWRDLHQDLARVSAELEDDRPPGLDLLARLARARPAWMRDGLCLEHPGVNFFPGVGESTAAAKAVCARCLVTDECLEYAVAGCEVGIWGGTTDKVRRAIRVRRKAA